MKFSPETLMAYADGELDTETRRQIEFAMATDPDVAEQIAKLKARRLELQTAFAGVLEEPVPDRLIEATKSAGASAPLQGSAPVTELAAVRAAKHGGRERRWSWRELTAMAATLLVGLIIGRNVLQTGESLVTANGRLEAGGPLAAALSRQTGGETSGGVAIGLTFKSRAGEYCRTFGLTGQASIAGLACRDDGAWRVDAIARTATSAEGDYRMAGAEMPPALLRAIEDSMAGDAFDAKEEAEAMRNDWK